MKINYKIQKLASTKVSVKYLVGCLIVYAVLSKWSNKSVVSNIFQYSYKAEDDVNNKSLGPLILLWTTFQHYTDFRFGLGQQPFIDHNCPVYNCTLTNDRSKIGQSEAVVFSIDDMEYNDIPTSRNWNQYWIFLSREPPHYSNYDLRLLNGFFNWTMTYRLDSDIMMPYGKTVPLAHIIAIRRKQVIKSKNHLVGWMVGHCETNGLREKYVEKLRNYIKVQQFGNCNSRPCFGACEKLFYNRYMFYLSFENNLCKDYVTEKLIKVLKEDVVPIVYGLGNYSAFAPPYSYIDVRDFESPKHLSQYLSALHANQTAYNEYFEWKNHYKVVNMGHPNFCDLCRRLHEINPPKVYQNIHNWWYNGAEDSEQSICSSEIKPFGL